MCSYFRTDVPQAMTSLCVTENSPCFLSLLSQLFWIILRNTINHWNFSGRLFLFIAGPRTCIYMKGQNAFLFTLMWKPNMFPLLKYVINQHIQRVWKLTGSRGRPKEVILLKWAVGGVEERSRAHASWHIHVKWSGLLCSGPGWLKPVPSGPALPFTYIIITSPAPPCHSNKFDSCLV